MSVAYEELGLISREAMPSHTSLSFTASVSAPTEEGDRSCSCINVGISGLGGRGIVGVTVVSYAIGLSNCMTALVVDTF